jgi:tRNA nucleotidyltransferase (CCA-adding enzyme)
MQILEQVLSRIKPGKAEEERVKAFAAEVLRVSKAVSGHDPALVGSIGKFTWLSGDHDVDVFLMFPKETTREELEQKGLEFGKKIVEQLNGRWKIKYAEHPYTHAMIKGFDVDIVPCYRISKGDKIISAVDRSPLHLEYILENLTPKMQDETRLLKQFCKGVGVYGSDAKHLGFSGYICELLVLYYGSFMKVIDAAASWRAPQIIDILGFADRTAFPDQPLVIVDPVDKNRNAAAVINAENFVKFIAASKAFVKKPDKKFFFPKPAQPLSAQQIKLLSERQTEFLALSFPKPDVIDDVLYPQLRKTVKRLWSLLEHNEFRVMRALELAGRSCYITFELEVSRLPQLRRWEGPPITSRTHTQEFLAKYEGKAFLYLDDNRWVAEIRRDAQTAVQLLGNFMRQPADKLIEQGIPKYVALEISKGKTASGSAFFSMVRRDTALSSYLREKYFAEYVKGL